MEADSVSLEHLTHHLLEHAPDAIVGVDRDGRIQLVNAQLERSFGYDRVELLGQPVELLVPERLRARHARHRSTFAAEPSTRPVGGELNLCGRRRDGSEFPIEISLSPIEGVRGLAAMAIIRDVTERRRQQARLEYLADHDELTGLLNRRAFMREIREHFEVAERYEIAGCLLLLDLDHFKVVNDTQGHLAGDAVLTDVAAALVHRTRRTDRVGRLGGDEFAILLPHVDRRQASAVARALIEAIREIPGPVTASVGIARLDPRTSADAAFATADLALYEAKASGRDQAAGTGDDALSASPTGPATPDDR